MLRFTPRAAAKVVEKVLRSAVANAEQRELGDSESMRVSQAYVDCGPTYKRFHARAMGRAASIHKRTSHITVVVEAPDSDARGIGRQGVLWDRRHIRLGIDLGIASLGVPAGMPEKILPSSFMKTLRFEKS